MAAQVTTVKVMMNRGSKGSFGFFPAKISIKEAEEMVTGIMPKDANLDFEAMLDMVDHAGMRKFKGGLVVGKVREGSTSAAGGLREWDVIVKVLGEDVRLCSAIEVLDKIKEIPNPVTLEVLRSR